MTVKQLDVYDLGMGLRAEFLQWGQHEQLRIGEPPVAVIIGRAQWLTLIEMLLPRVPEALRAEYRDELDRAARNTRPEASA